MATAGLALAFTVPGLAQVPQPTGWITAAPTALARSESQGIGIGNKLYVMGGFIGTNLNTTVNSEVYDASTNTWASMANMPEGTTHSGTAQDGDYFYIAGGFVGPHPGPITDHVWRYHIPTNTWSAFVPLPAARGAGMVVRLGRELHFFGGTVRIDGSPQYDTPEHWALNLDAATPAWTVRAPLPSPTNHLGGAVLNGKIYAIGGQFRDDEANGNQSFLWEYDPATNAWTAKASMLRPLGHIGSSTFVLNNRIVVAGGRLNGYIISNFVSEYNPVTNTWRDLTPLPVALLAPVVAVAGGRMVVNGGEDGNSVLATTWRSGAVLATRAAATDAAVLKLWPNPSDGQAVNLSIYTPAAGRCQLSVTDALGRVHHATELQKTHGTVQHTLATPLRPGLYTVVVQQEGYHHAQKLVIQ